MFIKIFTIIRKLLYSTGNPTQCSVMACMGKDSKKKGGDIYIKIWLWRVPFSVKLSLERSGDTQKTQTPAKGSRLEGS